MTAQSKIYDIGIIIKEKEEVEEKIKEARKRNIKRKIAYLYEEILKLEVTMLEVMGE